MLKKMLVVAVILAMTGTVWAGWNSKFGTDVPPKTIKAPDPADPNKEIDIPNPAYEALWGTDRSVDFEQWNSDQLFQRKAEVWNWPASYDFVEMAKITVRMEVGFWIKLDCRDHNVLTLKQKSINEYGGKTTCHAYTNVATEWKASFSKKSGVELGGDWDKEVKVDPATFNATGNSGKDISITMKLWGVSLAALTPNKDCLEIGTITVSVRPTVRPNTFMSGCSGSYPVYSPPPSNPWF